MSPRTYSTRTHRILWQKLALSRVKKLSSLHHLLRIRNRAKLTSVKGNIFVRETTNRCSESGLGIEERETTRVEDIAYCPLGVFNVNMPLLYGEGERAFIRLQEEIIKVSNDATIFAWRPKLIYKRGSGNIGMLAPSPRAFANATNLTWNSSHPDYTHVAPYMITNRGLQMQMQILPYKIPKAALNSVPNNYVVVVGVLPYVYDIGTKSDIGVLLRKREDSSIHHRWFSEELGVPSLHDVDLKRVKFGPSTPHIFLKV